MKSTTTLFVTALAAVQFFAPALADPVEIVPNKVIRATDPSQSPSAIPIPGAPTSHGCYSSGGNLTQVDVENLSSGTCLKACQDADYWVMGLHGDSCLCGYAYPPLDDVSKDKECDYPCPSYPLEACGGIGSPSHYSVFNTGLQVDVADYSPKKSSTSSSSSASKTATQSKTATDDSATTTAAATTSAAAAASTTAATGGGSDSDSDNTNDDDEKSSGGSNTAAIAGGVVGGVVVVLAVVGALFFTMRRKRNAEIEEEHRRNAAVNAFISGAKPPGSSDGISMTDSRLDPVMAHRRMSDGSIADNQDYSRRILRVTNA